MKFSKISGKSKQEFKTWCDQILFSLASPGWIKVFKNVKEKTLKTDDEISASLSPRLYAALCVVMPENAEKLMMTKPEKWGKGILFLCVLRKSYKVHLHQADLLKKEKECSLLFQSTSETIDNFAEHCI